MNYPKFKSLGIIVFAFLLLSTQAFSGSVRVIAHVFNGGDSEIVVANGGVLNSIKSGYLIELPAIFLKYPEEQKKTYKLRYKVKAEEKNTKPCHIVVTLITENNKISRITTTSDNAKCRATEEISEGTVNLNISSHH